MTRKRTRLVVVAAGILGAGLWGLSSSSTATESVEVWKSQSCDCCNRWVEHMRAAGFTVNVHNTELMDVVKQSRGVPEVLQSCHTAVVGGYVVEGHVPAPDIRRILAERPMAKGVTAPGMPQDAPGMDMGTGEPYQVLLFTGGFTRVFARH